MHRKTHCHDIIHQEILLNGISDADITKYNVTKIEQIIPITIIETACHQDLEWETEWKWQKTIITDKDNREHKNKEQGWKRVGDTEHDQQNTKR